MSWTQVAQHVRREIEGAGELGLDWVEFSEVVGRQIRRLVGYDAACWHTLDPATLLLTGNALTNLSDDGLPVLAACEYGPDDVNKWAFLARQPSVAGRLRAATQGQPRLSPRYRQLLHPSGIESELRVSFVDGSAGWGAAGFYRADENDEFTNDDEVFLAWLAPAVARGYRHALVLDLLDESQTPGGPGLIVLDAADEIQAISPPAEDWLGALMGGTPAGRTLPLAVLALAARARAMDDMGVAAESSARVRTPQGEWLLLRATPLHGATNGLLGITIEPAGPPDIAQLLLTGYGLSTREQEVAYAVLRGASTKNIANELSISPHTVQDHLKAIFDKLDVRSRRDMVARIYSEHYLPHVVAGRAPTPGGWFGSGIKPTKVITD